jgi:hypothetical protein
MVIGAGRHHLRYSFQACMLGARNWKVDKFLVTAPLAAQLPQITSGTFGCCCSVKLYTVAGNPTSVKLDLVVYVRLSIAIRSYAFVS